jgi:hypothetical protein
MEKQNTLCIFHNKQFSNLKSTFKGHKIKTYDFQKNINSTYFEWHKKDKEKLLVNDLHWTILHSKDVEAYTFVTVVQNPLPQAITMAKLILDDNSDCMYQIFFDDEDKIIEYQKIFFSLKQLVQRNAAKQQFTSRQYDLDDIEIIEPIIPSITAIFNNYEKAEEEYKTALGKAKADLAEKFNKKFKR